MPVRSAQAEWNAEFVVGCPISKALGANEITLDAALEG
jgi:hypothetical protein